MTRRAATTLVEICVATGLLGGLMVLALTAVTFTTRPAAETAIRSHLVTQGGQTMARLVAELEGARFFPSPFVGLLAGQAFVPDVDGDHTGTAVRGQRLLGWDARRGDFRLESDGEGVPTPFVWAFVAAGRDGSLSLVRAQQGLVVTALTDIEPGTASFRFVPPSSLAVAFTVRRPVAVDAQGAQRWAQARFEQTINLRDKNQR